MAQLLKKRKYHITKKKIEVLRPIEYSLCAEKYLNTPNILLAARGAKLYCSGLDVNKQGFERESCYVE